MQDKVKTKRQLIDELLEMRRRIAELEALEIERKQAQERFRLVVESALNAIVMVNQEGKIILVNIRAERIFGYSREELIGQPVGILVPERFRRGHPEYRIDFHANPQARPVGKGRDLFALRNDRSKFPVEIGLNPIQTE
jgi:PAS domain S-box-containing protein